MGFKVQYMTGAKGHAAQFEFETREDYNAWAEHVSNVKESVAAINEAYEDSKGLKKDKKIRDNAYISWLDSVRQFIQKWGRNHLPKDIEAAYVDIKENLEPECGPIRSLDD